MRRLLQLIDAVTSHVNPKLQGMNISVDIDEGFELDYSLTAPPTVDARTITTPLLGRIWWHCLRARLVDPRAPSAGTKAITTTRAFRRRAPCRL